MSSNRIGPWNTNGPAGADGADGADGSDGPGNIIINGDLNVWQRGTTFAAISNEDYYADRFQYLNSGDMVHTASRDTDVPTVVQSGNKSNYSIKVDCTTIDDSLASGDFAVGVQYVIEGYDYALLVGKEVTLSFWVKATKTGIYCLSLSNNGGDRSYVSEYTIDSVDTWEKKTVSVTIDQSGGTEEYKNGVGLKISWTLAAGSTYQAAADAWQSGLYLATSNQVNACDSTDNNFFLSQVKLEIGSSATAFTSKSIREDVSDCQRYFNKTYDTNVDPGTIDNNGKVTNYITGIAVGSHVMQISWRYKSEMRAAPAVATYGTTGGTIGKVNTIAGEVDSVVNHIGTSSCDIQGTGVSNADALLTFHATADAEL